MVGCPGSGKSTLRSIILNKYDMFVYSPDDHILMSEFKKNINKTNIIIDATNPSFDTRLKYYRMFDNHIYDYLIIHFNIDKLICGHLNYVRFFRSTKTNNTIPLVPIIAYRIYNKNLTDPKDDKIKLGNEYNIKVINIDNLIDYSKITVAKGFSIMQTKMNDSVHLYLSSEEYYMYYDIE